MAITYIALLRGINVSGSNIIKMTELKQLFLELGFSNVNTYIQSGNVIFETNLEEPDKIEQQIKDAINRTFVYKVNVLVLTKNSLETIFASNPFLQKSDIDISKLHVTLLSNEPLSEGIEQINEMTKNQDEFEIVDNCIYLYCPNGYGNTKLNNNLFEKKLKVSATTRNWNTISKLVELSNL
jgi:uncharacterized protein (DUF1697 family)